MLPSSVWAYPVLRPTWSPQLAVHLVEVVVVIPAARFRGRARGAGRAGVDHRVHVGNYAHRKIINRRESEIQIGTGHGKFIEGVVPRTRPRLVAVGELRTKPGASNSRSLRNRVPIESFCTIDRQTPGRMSQHRGPRSTGTDHIAPRVFNDGSVKPRGRQEADQLSE